MTNSDSKFLGSIPDIYDAYLVPLIFEAPAEDMAQRVADLEPAAVLETAAGSGVVTRALAARLPGSTRYVASDLNQPMLDRAASQQPDAARIEWQEADALDLPFEEATFDVVCCQFGVMFFPDRVAGYREARRVLRPGGRFVFNVWDRIANNEFADVVTQAAKSVFPDDPPLFLARTPHGHQDTEKTLQEMAQAGFGDLSVSVVEARSIAPDPSHPAIAYCQGTPLRNEIVARDPDSLESVTTIATNAVRERFGNGPVDGLVRGFVFSGTA